MIAADMFHRHEARGLGNAVDTASTDHGFLGELEPPSWSYSDVLKGFDEFMDIVPNFANASEGLQGVTQADANLDETSSQRRTRHTTEGKSTAAKRRQHKNKLAQQRFRERQKVRLLCTRNTCQLTSVCN